MRRHGIALFLTVPPLFDSVIEAWVHGPVIPALYPLFADYKWCPIPMRSFDESNFDDDTLDVLQAVYDTYGDLSGNQLENLTHTEEPWIQARGNLKPWEPCTNHISCESMRTYYSRKYEQVQND